MTLYCPHCGQRVLLRLGVHLSPARADVFDVIKRWSKSGGVRIDGLVAILGKRPHCLKVHINHINRLLAPTGWRIVCHRLGSAKGFYRLRKQRFNHGEPACLEPSGQTLSKTNSSYSTQPAVQRPKLPAI